MNIAIIRDLCWSIGLMLMLLSHAHSKKLIKDEVLTKFPLYAKIVFLIGAILFVISFYIPVPALL